MVGENHFTIWVRVAEPLYLPGIPVAGQPAPSLEMLAANSEGRYVTSSQ